MTHPIIEDLQWRYTTKKYDPSRRVSAEDLAVLCEALRLSPSSIDSQPWKFIVIGSGEAKARFDRTFANRFQFNQPHVFDASHIILFAHNPRYTREDFARVVDRHIEIGRIPAEGREKAFASFVFAEMNTDAQGNNAAWTKAQTYLTLGNVMHALARLRIDSTAMEGIDSELVKKEFAAELGGYECDVALAIGYHLDGGDYNVDAPKSRLAMEQVVKQI